MAEFQRSTHFPALLDDIGRSRVDALPVKTLGLVAPRSDGLGVFAEGEDFSGTKKLPGVEACITMTASPHLATTVRPEDLLGAARRVLGREPIVSDSLRGAHYVSPQLIVWWRNPDTDRDTDFIGLSHDPPETRRNAAYVIASQTERAVSILEKTVEGTPIIWGSWGHGKPEERANTGLSRGAPTNANGHLHVSTFQPDSEVEVLPLTPREQLNRYAPWSNVLHDALGDLLSGTIRRAIEAAEPGVACNVAPYSRLSEDEYGVASRNNGHSVSFHEPQPYADVANMLIEIAGALDGAYQKLAGHFEEYYSYPSRPESDRRSVFMGRVKSMGFSDEEAERIVRFSCALRPTRGQLARVKRTIEESGGAEERKQDLSLINAEIERYQRVYGKLRGRELKTGALILPLLVDTTASPECGHVERTWPVHLGAVLTIDDYRHDEGGLSVNSFNLTVGVATFQSAVESITGRSLRRSHGESK